MSVDGTVVPLGDNISDDVQHPGYSRGFYLAAKTVSGLPKPIELIINSIGTVNTGTCVYQPALPKDIVAKVNGIDRFCPQPDRLTISNLRTTVAALADPTTPDEWRSSFFARSPIPGQVTESNLLTNAAEIMPPGYDEERLLSDIRELGNLNPIIQKYATKLSETILSWDTAGSQSLLLTTGETPAARQELPDYYKVCNPIGNATNHWSTHELTQADKMVGVVTMTGETQHFENLAKPLFTIRAPEIAGYVVTLSREATVRLLFA